VRVAVCLAVALSLAAIARGADEPVAFGSARLGSLSVTSGVFVSARAVDLMGVWTDTKVSCLANRRLRVRAVVDYVPATGKPRRVERVGRFRSPNCAEGGPNVGFTLTARKLGFACPNGTWKPARYNFLTQTTEPRRGLRATASLIWFKKGRC
jgi:hypothetical protein